MNLPVSFRPAAALAVATVAGFGAGWAVNGWRAGAAVAECKAASAGRDADAATQALEKVQKAATAVQDAASASTAASAKIVAETNAARRSWDALVKRNPLPAGCAPGTERAEAMREAIERTRGAMK